MSPVNLLGILDKLIFREAFFRGLLSLADVDVECAVLGLGENKSDRGGSGTRGASFREFGLGN